MGHEGPPWLALPVVRRHRRRFHLLARSLNGLRVIVLVAIAVLVAEPGVSLASDGSARRQSSARRSAGRTARGRLRCRPVGRRVRRPDRCRIIRGGRRLATARRGRARRQARRAGRGRCWICLRCHRRSRCCADGDCGDPTTASERRAAIILFNFTNDTSQPWTTTTASDTAFGASASVAAYYREVSYENTTLGGNVFGWVTIPYDNTGCRYSDWGRAALAATGLDPAQFDHVYYAFPRATSCGWAGLSTIGGSFAWINGAMTVRTVGHELAHMLGVHHASALNCTANGARVTYSSTCTRSEYGDPFSIMGLGTRHHNHWHRAQIGWLPETITITSSGSYVITPAELTAQPRLLRVGRGDGTYLYFEFRQPFGAYDNFSSTAAAVKGVTVRIAPDKAIRVQSLLLDMTPSSASFDDAALAVGRSFTDPLSHVTVTTTAVSSGSATIAVQFPGADAPTPSPTPARRPRPPPARRPRPPPARRPRPPPARRPRPPRHPPRSRWTRSRRPRT